MFMGTGLRTADLYAQRLLHDLIGSQKVLGGDRRADVADHHWALCEALWSRLQWTLVQDGWEWWWQEHWYQGRVCMLTAGLVRRGVGLIV